MKFFRNKFLAVSLLLLTVPIFALAQGGLVPCGGAGQNPCSICDLGILTINVTNFLIYNIAIPLAGLMILVGGLMIMIGSSSEERVKVGKKMLTNAVIGVVIVFIAWLLVDTVIKVLTGSYAQRNFFGTFGPWNRIPSGACPFGGGIATANPTPEIQPPKTTVPTAEILREGPGGPGRQPARDLIIEDAAVITDPVANTVTIESPDGTKTTIDLTKEGAGIAIVRAAHPNVFVVGGDLSVQDALKLKESLDTAYSRLPNDYKNLKDSYILVPSTKEMYNDLLKEASANPEKPIKSEDTLAFVTAISKGNTMVFGGIARGDSPENIAETAVHELAHQRASAVTGRFGDVEWQNLHVESIKTGAFSTVYAGTSLAEDLAETVMIASDPKAIQYTGNPQKDAVLKQKYEYLKRKGFIKQVPTPGVG